MCANSKRLFLAIPLSLHAADFQFHGAVTWHAIRYIESFASYYCVKFIQLEKNYVFVFAISFLASCVTIMFVLSESFLSV